MIYNNEIMPITKVVHIRNKFFLNWFIHELTAHGTSKTAKITKR